MVTDDELSVAHSRAVICYCGSWGSAPLHPRLDAIAALRGLKQIQLTWGLETIKTLTLQACWFVPSSKGGIDY